MNVGTTASQDVKSHNAYMNNSLQQTFELEE
jgi:hypothetical protein